jgi:transposase InsO family protein
VVVQLRRLLLLPLDDLLAVTREFLNPDVSRSGLDRCLRRHGVSNLKALLPKTPAEPRKTFKAYQPGFLHVDLKYLPQMADETSRRYLFVAIDRATRWVFVRILPTKTAANARKFLRDLHRACPIRITKMLTDRAIGTPLVRETMARGKEFTDRLFASRARAASGSHEFDQLCAELGIEHRLTPPKSPQTNGMVERFNGRIADVLKTNRFDSALDLVQTLMRYVVLYTHSCRSQPLGAERRCRP